jgi:Na+-driven multidrug efflux pump
MSMVIGVCRAGGDTKFTVFLDVFFMWTLALPLAALASFALGAPVWLMYLCIAADEPLKAYIGWRRLKSGKWLHNVT